MEFHPSNLAIRISFQTDIRNIFVVTFVSDIRNSIKQRRKIVHQVLGNHRKGVVSIFETNFAKKSFQRFHILYYDNLQYFREGMCHFLTRCVTQKTSKNKIWKAKASNLKKKTNLSLYYFSFFFSIHEIIERINRTVSSVEYCNRYSTLCYNVLHIFIPATLNFRLVQQRETSPEFYTEFISVVFAARNEKPSARETQFLFAVR